MNPVPILLPDLGTETCQLSLWHVQPGERVREGERIAEVLIPGIVIDIAAPVTGRLIKKLALPHDTLTTQSVLGLIEPQAES